MVIQYHRRSGVFFFKTLGITFSQFLKIHFKEVVLDLLAPICKREKSGIHSRGFLSLEMSFPALDGGVDILSTAAFFPWSDLVCSLLTQASYLSLLVLPLRQGGDALGIALMASQIDLVAYRQDLYLISTFLLMPPRM